ncbi:neural cell adhesion molecule 2-like [Antedon mediterranea]|uniref:neural cell adhesion molecule 2-like n=1 Tax=Antedon mediterranea TaxID=105859 RepID=UPI003AF51D69
MSNLVLYLCFCCLPGFITAFLHVSQAPDNITELVDEDVTFRCQFSGLVEEQVIWFHTESNAVLTPNVDMNGWLNLTIHNVGYADEGEYKCGYTTIRGDRTEYYFPVSAFLDIITRPNSPSCSATYPSGIDFPVIGNNVSIICSAPGGDPNPTISWFRNDEVKSMASEMNSSLSVVLSSLQEEDRGVAFRCDITSPALGSVESCQIIPFPEIPIINITYNGQVDFGSNIPFQCNFDGDLPLTILSFLTSIASDRVTLNSERNVLKISNFQEDDLKETVTCRVVYDGFAKEFTSTVDFEEILPYLSDIGQNTDDKSSLIIVLSVLAVIIVILILVTTALLWHFKAMCFRTRTGNYDIGFTALPKTNQLPAIPPP